MKKFIFSLVTMALSIVPSMAQDIADIPDNSVYTADASAESGGQFVLSFQMKNSADVEAVGLYFYLPEGFSVAKNDRGRLIYSMNANRNDSHSLMVSGPHPTGEYRASILNPAPDYVLVGHEGEIFNVTVDVAETVASGIYYVKLKQVELSCLGKIVSQDGTYTGKINVTLPTAVKDAIVDTADGEVEIYDINGIKLPKMRSGINIVKDASGGKTFAVKVK